MTSMQHDLESISILDLINVYEDLATDADLDVIHATIAGCDDILADSPLASFEYNGFALLRGALIYLASGIVHRLAGRIDDALRAEAIADNIASSL